MKQIRGDLRCDLRVLVKTPGVSRRQRRTDLAVDRWHGELHVAMGDVGLAVVKAAAAEKLLADGGERSVTAYNQVRPDLLLGPV